MLDDEKEGNLSCFFLVSISYTLVVFNQSRIQHAKKLQRVSTVTDFYFYLRGWVWDIPLIHGDHEIISFYQCDINKKV